MRIDVLFGQYSADAGWTRESEIGVLTDFIQELDDCDYLSIYQQFDYFLAKRIIADLPTAYCVKEYASEENYQAFIRYDCRSGYTREMAILEAECFTKVNPGAVAVVDSVENDEIIVFREGVVQG